MQGEKKQIEEMAAIIEQANKDAIKNPGQMKTLGQDWFGKWYASALYDAGCRMQSEGEWIKDNTSNFEHRYNCSVCDFRQVGKPTPYCPNCGARMKGV